ncbi:hypothetical protein GGR42_002161 [Saonia flava]|uniref:Uncharacterized protein n=1 Tax=Saonia flava TaxID=523696 RepID=A0A846R4G9_9FLAO|nr:hypothetical protein [Saonia flava]NJB71699.1 hypothetical protein [Saonia flava]
MEQIEKKIEKKIERRMKKRLTKAVKIIFAIIFGILMAILVGYVVMRLWNWLMPDLFGLTTITYWQAVGIFILAKLFFGMGHCGSNGGGKKAKNKFKNRKCESFRNDFSEWKHYDKFWKEEGETAYKEYVERKQKEQ